MCLSGFHEFHNCGHEVVFLLAAQIIKLNIVRCFLRSLRQLQLNLWFLSNLGRVFTLCHVICQLLEPDLGKPLLLHFDDV